MLEEMVGYVKQHCLLESPHSLWFYFQAFFSANAAALASRKSSPRVTNESVQKAVSASFFIFLPF